MCPCCSMFCLVDKWTNSLIHTFSNSFIYYIHKMFSVLLLKVFLAYSFKSLQFLLLRSLFTLLAAKCMYQIDYELCWVKCTLINCTLKFSSCLLHILTQKCHPLNRMILLHLTEFLQYTSRIHHLLCENNNNYTKGTNTDGMTTVQF